MDFLERLEEADKRLEDLTERMSSPEVASNHKRYQEVAREAKDLREVVDVFREYKKVREDAEQSKVLMEDADADIRAMAKDDHEHLVEKLQTLENRLKILLIPKDPNDGKNVILEIRAGTGGDEAGLFAGDLARMYVKFAEREGWKIETLSHHEAPKGGFKEIITLLTGPSAFSKLKYESGVHRVQRVPETEAQGRIHTSAVSVAVLPEAEDVEIDVAEKDLRVDVYRSGGPGGQSVNTTDSAVRITHLPTGLVVTCQDEKSQHKNKAKALKILKSRLLVKMQEEQNAAIAKERKSMIGTGDRSERIRTYNFPQGRCTDHRIGLTLYKLQAIMEGDLQELIQGLNIYYQTEALKGPGEATEKPKVSDDDDD